MDLLKRANAFLLGTRFAREAHAHGRRRPHGGRSASVNIGAFPEPRHGAVAVARVISADHSSTGRVVMPEQTSTRFHNPCDWH